MATVGKSTRDARPAESTPPTPPAPSGPSGQAAGSLRFDWGFALLLGLLTGGIYLDGWAHNHGKVDQSFFTLWHAVLYSAFALVGLFLVVTVLRNHQEGYAWWQAVPAGYETSLLGVVIFAVGGVGDLAWHVAFGIERGIEGLISPTHLTLALGGVLVATGPLRAAWQRREASVAGEVGGAGQGWRALGPAVLSLTSILSALTFFTQYAHPVTSERAAQVVTTVLVSAPGASHFESSLVEVVGVVSVLLQAAILMGVVLLAIRSWQLPMGAFALLFGLNGVLMATQAPNTSVLPVVLRYGSLYALVGLAADLLHRWLQPSAERVGGLRIFAFAVPFLLFEGYFLAILVLHGTIAWSVHVWTGTVVLAGVVGLLLSYVLVPPRFPAGGSAP